MAALHTRFRFVFVDAPFKSPPGPGIRPAFTDFGPFWRWHCDPNIINEFDITPEDVARERRHVRGLLRSYFERERAVGGPGIVGVMAFSQGTRVATGLCLDRELRKGVQFAILIASTFPSLDLTAPEEEADEALEELGFPSRPSPAASSADKTPPSSRWNDHRVNIISIHIQGTADPWASEGARLREAYYNPELATTIKFHGGHQVPTGATEARMIAEAFNGWREEISLQV